MELRAVDCVRVADKTVLKVMNEMGLRFRIRKEAGRHGYSSYRGAVGETFENVIGRDFSADGPWQKLGTDVTEFKLSFGRAYLALAYDFGSKEIVAWSISEHPDLAQQEEMLEALMAAKPEGASPVMHSDMGWQDQHDLYVSALRGNGFTQSMSRKGNCIDNGATEQVFGHLKDEFFRGRDWDSALDYTRNKQKVLSPPVDKAWWVMPTPNSRLRKRRLFPYTYASPYARLSRAASHRPTESALQAQLPIAAAG